MGTPVASGQSVHQGLDLLRPAATGRHLIAKRLASLAPRKLPVDRRSLAVGLAIPRCGLSLQEPQIQESPGAQTLPRVQAQFDLRLIEPASMFGCVVYGEPLPEATALLLAEAIHQRLGAVRVEVVQDQVDRAGRAIPVGEVADHAGELSTGPIRRGRGEVSTDFRLYDAKHIRRSAAFVLVVAFGGLSRLGRDRRAHVAV